MSNIDASKPVTNKTYVFGQDVEDMTDQGLINSIKRLEKEIDDLGSVKTQSKKIKAMIETITKSKDEIVALLDSRA